MEKTICIFWTLTFLFIKFVSSHDCYHCASSTESSVADDPHGGICYEGSNHQKLTTEPCCRDPFDQKNKQQAHVKTTVCTMCIKVKYTWADRPKTAFYRRMCYDENDKDSFARVISTTVSGGDTISTHKKVEEVEEAKEKLEELEAGVLAGECRDRDIPSPLGDITLEMCGCRGDFCNHATVTAATSLATAFLTLLTAIYVLSA